jgi:hypothetical protein
LVQLVGSSPKLGAWQVQHGLQGKGRGGQHYFEVPDLSPGSSHEFKVSWGMPKLRKCCWD